MARGMGSIAAVRGFIYRKEVGSPNVDRGEERARQSAIVHMWMAEMTASRAEACCLRHRRTMPDIAGRRLCVHPQGCQFLHVIESDSPPATSTLDRATFAR